MTWEEWLAQSEIVDSLPLTFPSGAQRWTQITVTCGDCKHDAPDLRGVIEPQYGPVTYREAPSVVAYLMTAQAHCERCHSLTHLHCLFRDDMTYTQYDWRTGEPVGTSKAEPKRPWYRRWF